MVNKLEGFYMYIIPKKCKFCKKLIKKFSNSICLIMICKIDNSEVYEDYCCNDNNFEFAADKFFFVDAKEKDVEIIENLEVV
jgi:hypothetical protein